MGDKATMNIAYEIDANKRRSIQQLQKEFAYTIFKKNKIICNGNGKKNDVIT